ncbi:helix-turn-helix transcriptional regulator [Lentilitoribacter sp. EG35]|uniref:helix-turn-helix transcriptional regulator n=1 Tax=Lentilitoribacter sp. EG35 TaxID=3234192 RepID=UPI00345F460A
MRKVDRLFEIVQLLRGKRLRTAEFIAAELGVSQRTIYRDISGLMASGIPIEGERGVGYLINQPIDLPPLHFTPLELKALRLGADMVKAIADTEMAAAAEEASFKIIDALPTNRRTMSIRPSTAVYIESDAELRETLGIIRGAVDNHDKVEIDYRDKAGQATNRVMRPLGLEYWGHVWTCTTWCELRDDFRVFRVDLIERCSLTGQKFKLEKGKTYKDYGESMRRDDI